MYYAFRCSKPESRPPRGGLPSREARRIGTACAWDGSKPIAIPMPFYLRFAAMATQQRLFHLAVTIRVLKIGWGLRHGYWHVNGPDAMSRQTGMVSRTRCRTWYISRDLTAGADASDDETLPMQVDAQRKSRTGDWTEAALTRPR